MSKSIMNPITESDLIQIRCDVHTNVMVGKSGKCYRRDFCNEKGSNDCGEVLLINKKLAFLREAKILKKVI